MATPQTPGTPAASPPTTTPAAPAPAAAPPPAAGTAAPAAPPPAAAQPPPAEPTDPTWLPARLEGAKKTGANQREQELMRTWGVSSMAEVEAAIAAKKAADAANLSAEERARVAQAEAQTNAASLAKYRQAVSVQAAAELEKLTETQRAAVKEIAGDDPAEQVLTVARLRATWGTAPAGPAPPATNGGTSQPGSTTTAPPAGGAPPPAATSPTDYKAEHARLKQENPYAAAMYMNLHADKIYPRST